MGKKQEQDVLSSDNSGKKEKKEAVALLREGISKFETALTLAIADGNKQAQIAAEQTIGGLKLKLAKIKEL